MRHALRFLILLAIAAPIASCGPSVFYHRDPGVKLRVGAAWAWGRPDGDGLLPSEGAIAPTDSVARLIATAIEDELVAAGFPRVEPGQAEFLIHFHAGRWSVTDTLPPRDDPVARPGLGNPQGNWGSYGRPEDLSGSTVTWDEGMLIVDAVTRDNRIVAWRGAIAGEVPAKAAADPGPALRAAIRRLMRGFP